MTTVSVPPAAPPRAAQTGGGPPRLDPLGPSGAYRTRAATPVHDTAGETVAELGLVPAVFVSRAVAALRRARPLSPARRWAALARAGELFAEGTVGGLTPARYEELTARVSGVPIAVVRAATATTRRRLAGVRDTVERACPAGAVLDPDDPATRAGTAVWSRCGEVFGVHVSGVHPGAHGMWPEALALGYRVAVRPSRREPFTAHRMVSALREAGFGDDHVVLLPCENEAADVMLRGVDLAYGGDDVIRRYADDPGVITQEPGRSKILLAADVDWREHVDTIVASVADHGGAGCVSATGLLVEGDPGPVAAAVATRLAALPSLPATHDDAVLPVQAEGPAAALEGYLADRAGDATALLGGAGVADPLPGGGAVLRPAVHVVPDAGDERLGVELPFPCLWVAPWTREDGTEPLRDTLTLTAITRDDDLVDALLEEPGITNLHVGDIPTHWTEVGLPHEGHLADSLMRSRVVRRW